MLVLSRKNGEKVLIGDNIVVTILEHRGGYTRVGIEAPKDVAVLREEVAERMKAGKWATNE